MREGMSRKMLHSQGEVNILLTDKATTGTGDSTSWLLQNITY